MTRLAVALTVLTAVGLAVVAGVTVAVVCRCLARDEEQHDDCGVCPGCDPGPDDLEAVAEAVGVVAAMTQPLSWELAKTPAIRAMTLVNSAAWLATARDIDTLPVFRGGAR